MAARAMEPLIETLSMEEQIRRRAYELYVQRGSAPGLELDDWLQAEQEISADLQRHRPRKAVSHSGSTKETPVSAPLSQSA